MNPHFNDLIIATLRRAAFCATASILLLSRAHAEEASAASQIENFADQLPVVMEWTSANLQAPVPETIGHTVKNMEEGLKDEAAKTPQASLASYGLAEHICQALTGALGERGQILKQNIQTANGVISAQLENQWEARVDVYRAAIGKAYTQFREEVRQSPDPEKAPKTWSVAAVQFPPLPNPARSQVQNADAPSTGTSTATTSTPPSPSDSNPGRRRARARARKERAEATPPVTAANDSSNPADKRSANPLDKKGANASVTDNPLDRGAYDKKRIWVPRAWWIY